MERSCNETKSRVWVTRTGRGTQGQERRFNTSARAERSERDQRLPASVVSCLVSGRIMSLKVRHRVK